MNKIFKWLYQKTHKHNWVHIRSCDKLNLRTYYCNECKAHKTVKKYKGLKDFVEQNNGKIIKQDGIKFEVKFGYWSLLEMETWLIHWCTDYEILTYEDTAKRNKYSYLITL